MAHPASRLVSLFLIFGVTSIAWVVFAGFVQLRTHGQEQALSGAVADLWGSPMVQSAPLLQIERTEWVEETRAMLTRDGQVQYDENGAVVNRTERVQKLATSPVALDHSAVGLDLSLDQRRKGLLWFSLYDVSFAGDYGYRHVDEAGTLIVRFEFPQADGIYDDFKVVVNGVERWDAEPIDGAVVVRVPVVRGDEVRFSFGYRSRGRDAFTYRPIPGWQTGQVKDLRVAIRTDFDEIDFPAMTTSPSTREKLDGGGEELVWDFRRIVTGQGMGMVMPSQVQAGPLVSAMSLSAPLSLGLYMIWITVLGLVKQTDVHPVNHVFLAAAFFAFHLVFGYSADHLPVEASFGLAALTSLFLTTSYLRLVVGPRFALVEAGVAQLLYQVGFSLAHFWDGFTGLTVTVLGVATLFAIMQLTGRIRWEQVLARADTPPPAPTGPRSYTPISS